MYLALFLCFFRFYMMPRKKSSWCFYLNIPYRVFSALIVVFFHYSPKDYLAEELPTVGHLNRIDPLGLILCTAAIVYLILVFKSVALLVGAIHVSSFCSYYLVSCSLFAWQFKSGCRTVPPFFRDS